MARRDRATRLAATIDELLWDDAQGLWVDAPLLGDGDTSRTPTLDGILGALVTADASKATRAVNQIIDPARFAAPYGLAFVARDHPAYDPDGYWRGTAWMQMNYLTALAAQRWGRTDLTKAIASMSRAAVQHSQFAEHRNPETGQGHGAIPLTWSALVITFKDRP